MSYENHPNVVRISKPTSPYAIKFIMLSRMIELLDPLLIEPWLSSEDNDNLFLMSDEDQEARIDSLVPGADEFRPLDCANVFGISVYNVSTMTPGADDPEVMVNGDGLLEIAFNVLHHYGPGGGGPEYAKSTIGPFIKSINALCRPGFPSWVNASLLMGFTASHLWPSDDTEHSPSYGIQKRNKDMPLCSVLLLGEYKDHYKKRDDKKDFFFGRFNTTERLSPQGGASGMRIYDPNVESWALWFQPRTQWSSLTSWSGVSGAESLMGEATTWALSSAILSECMSIVPTGYKAIHKSDGEESTLEFFVSNLVIRSVRVDEDVDNESAFGTYDVIGYISPRVFYQDGAGVAIHRRSGKVNVSTKPADLAMDFAIPFFIGRYDLSSFDGNTRNTDSLVNFTFDVMNALSELIDMGVGIDFECQACNISASSLGVNDFDRLYMASIAPSTMLHVRVCSKCRMETETPVDKYPDASPDPSQGASTPDPKGSWAPQRQGRTFTTALSGGAVTSRQIASGTIHQESMLKAASSVGQPIRMARKNNESKTAFEVEQETVGDISIHAASEEVRSNLADMRSRFASMPRKMRGK